jgi:hypothetical protein
MRLRRGTTIADYLAFYESLFLRAIAAYFSVANAADSTVARARIGSTNFTSDIMGCTESSAANVAKRAVFYACRF